MTDVNVAASPTATLLADYLSAKQPRLEAVPYRGVLTPLELDARLQEIEVLRSGCALHDLGWLRRVAVQGGDRFRWLSGMVTNMVKDLAPDAGAWNLVLNAQGRIQGDLMVWRQPPQQHGPVAGKSERDGDDLELEIEAFQYEKILAHLNHFIIMDDVDLVPLEGDAAIGLTGANASRILTALGLPALSDAPAQARAQWNGAQVLVRRGYGVLAEHYALWIAASQAGTLWEALAAAGAKPVGAAALEAFRIAEGIPVYGVDIVDRDLPQETSQMHTLHFNKGCYLGQEIVERIRSRGNVHRHLRSFELDGPLPSSGTKLTLEGAEAGHITSAAVLPLSGATRVFALGVMRAEAEARNEPLNYEAEGTAGTARFSASPPTL
ncbi:MAG TPA: folate-binding protein [Terracidiphilus sp.]|nr:folate-binding protein [Terracidiphilus sp.]